MCRDIDMGRKLFPVDTWGDSEKLHLVKGDVTDPTSLSSAIEGSSAVISVHGTFHATPLYKLLLPIFWTTHVPLNCEDVTHPYYTNFVAMQDIVSLCEKFGVKRVVRLTGLSCAMPPYHPVSVLFNALLSFSGRYHRMGEEVLRSSDKVSTFILRPGGLSDEPRDPNKTKLQVDFGGTAPPPGRIGRADVADLAVAAVTDERVCEGSFVAGVRWVGEVAPKTQGKLEEGGSTTDEALTMALAQNKVAPPSITRGNLFALFHGIYVYSFFAALAKLAIFAGSKILPKVFCLVRRLF
ncbi:hypothetical protein TrLO_g10592 [Triparma laevis f. longispina]|uniref:NAD(P)-binding domain-containing protein n=1 Tax=Triparma laevis f. longispina TaxID=1714387 RepID=A0A9W7EEH3_9STRA|nr:hypothetical protein TrLO_g10592 [Triparma laevis f. longispina]